MFRPGTLVLPPGSTGAPTEEVTISSSGIAQLFAQYEVDSVAKTFPNFQLADTLGVARTGEVVRLVNFSYLYTLVVPETSDRAALCASLDDQPEVVYAHPNGGVEPCIAPNDPQFQNGDQWNLHNTGQNGGVPDADIDAPEAWEITTGSAQTIIGIIDSGIDLAHDEFVGKASGDPEVGTSHHGTRVAGIAAANTDNGTGIAGVDWNARLFSGRFFAAQPEELDQVAVDAIRDALGAGAHILNNSWVLTAFIPIGDPRYSSTVEGAFSDAYKLNRVAVAAMGNGSVETTYWPAAFGQGIIAVSATNRLDQRGTFSSSGPHVDVSAPGEAIPIALPGNGYGVGSGTSAATPHVSGLAGLMLGVNPNLYNDDIEQIIRLSADDVGDPGFDHVFGTGRINARRALERLLGPYVLRGLMESGGTIVNSSVLYPLTFVGVSGLQEGQYTVRRHEVRKAVVFPVPSLATPDVWGRGVATTGFSAEGSSAGSPEFGINFGRGWCEPVPGTVTPLGCTLRTFTYEVYDGGLNLIGWYPSTAANVIYGYAVLGIDANGGGGCPFVDTRTAAGWREENSVLGRSLTGSLALDAYRLKFPPEMRDGRLQLRLRENEQEYTTLDEVRLVAVDHPPELRAYPVGERLVLGTRAAAYRVTTHSGRDVTPLVSGLGGYYQGQPGDTLWVEMTAPTAGAVDGPQSAQEDPGGPGILEGDPKEMEIVFDDGLQTRGTYVLGATDADVLSGTGILVEVSDGAGGWRSLAHHYPRRYRDETALDSLARGTFRLIFVGRHRLHFIGRVVPASSPPAPREMGLFAAHHSRLGNALTTVDKGDGDVTSLAPGDTLTLEFAAAAPLADRVRDWFLMLRGLYSSAPFASSLAQSQGAEAPMAGLGALTSRPNPFSELTTIQFAVPVATSVRLEIMDIQGRMVRALAHGGYAAGLHLVEWDACDARGRRVPPGVYLYRLTAGSHQASARVLVLGPHSSEVRR